MKKYLIILALLIANSAYADMCGPFGCIESDAVGKYFKQNKDGTYSEYSHSIFCVEGLTAQERKERYGFGVGNLCGYTLFLEKQEEQCIYQRYKWKRKYRRCRKRREHER